MNEYFPTVVQVIPLDNFHVQVFFDDGKIVDYDATEDLKAEIFKPLRDIDAFKEACTVMNGTLAWDLSGNRDESSCIDIDPFTVYECYQSLYNKPIFQFSCKIKEVLA